MIEADKTLMSLCQDLDALLYLLNWYKSTNTDEAHIHRYIDDVIEPETTRMRLCQELDALLHKDLKNPWKKHGNIPL